MLRKRGDGLYPSPPIRSFLCVQRSNVASAKAGLEVRKGSLTIGRV